MVKPLYKPGMDNKPAGRYREVGPRGGAVSNPRTVDDRPRRQAPADAGAGTPLGARLAPRQAPSVIGAPPCRALFGFQGARKRGRRAHARARP